jgi:hypothetical protein
MSDVDSRIEAQKIINDKLAQKLKELEERTARDNHNANRGASVTTTPGAQAIYPAVGKSWWVGNVRANAIRSAESPDAGDKSQNALL